MVLPGSNTELARHKRTSRANSDDDDRRSSVFEGVISDSTSIESLTFADRAGQESYRVLLAYKMGQPIEDPSVAKELAKFLAFVYLVENGRAECRSLSCWAYHCRISLLPCEAGRG